MNRLNLKRAIELHNYLDQVDALLIKMQMVNNPHILTINEQTAYSYTLEVKAMEGYDDERRKFIEDMHGATIGFLQHEKNRILNEFETL